MPELSIALIQAAIRGDRRAVREVVDLLMPMVHSRVARAVLRHERRLAPNRDLRGEFEDVLQSVFLFLFSDDASVLLRWTPGQGMSLRNYIGLVAEREAMSVLRNRRSSSWTEDPATGGLVDGRSAPPPAADGGAERDVVSLLFGRIESHLNERDLVLFHLIVIEERSVEEICTLMDVTVDDVSNARSRFACLARKVAAELMAEGKLLAEMPIVGRA